jgi:hypothetical protein
MAVKVEDENKKYFRDGKMYLRKFTMEYGRLIAFIRHDSAEIWGFGMDSPFFIRTLKIKASTGVFVRVVCALRRSIKYFPCSPSTNFPCTNFSCSPNDGS